MLRSQDRAATRREGARTRRSDDDPEAFVEEQACTTCGARYEARDMFLTENGPVCAEHFDG
jgi:hypothetical protein